MATIDMHLQAPAQHLGERVRVDRGQPVVWPDIPCGPSEVYDVDEGSATLRHGPDARDIGREPARTPGRR
jgi:hypothetical protein